MEKRHYRPKRTLELSIIILGLITVIVLNLLAGRSTDNNPAPKANGIGKETVTPTVIPPKSNFSVIRVAYQHTPDGYRQRLAQLIERYYQGLDNGDSDGRRRAINYIWLLAAEAGLGVEVQPVLETGREDPDPLTASIARLALSALQPLAVSDSAIGQGGAVVTRAR